jgi:GntR family transcriptional regulator/MocR family aminotransferase
VPDGVDEAALAAEAERRGVRTYTLESSRIECSEPRGLVLGYANASERELREAAELLAAALAAVR